MIIITLCAAIITLTCWLAFTEWRLHRLQRAVMTALDATKKVGTVSAAHNDTIEILKAHDQALVQATHGNAHDIAQAIYAINKISNEVFDDEILQSPIKHTIQ